MAILTRNKIIGVLLRDARLCSGTSVQECAQALSREPEWFLRAELGEVGLTLPQLESVAHVLHVPLSRFLGDVELPDDGREGAAVPYADIMTTRRKIIGVILRQSRMQAGRTVEDTGAALDLTPDQLEAIERGEAEIGLAELEALAGELGLPFDAFVAEDLVAFPTEVEEGGGGELPAHIADEIRDFVLQPINLPYLQIAQNLSEMPAETLRQIAAGLLEITY